MHPSHHAKTNPDKPAYIMSGSGETVTYGQLEARSNQGAHLFRSLGIGRGFGHPAKLNYSDCFAYALAKTRGLPLLYKGDDFTHTDVVSALL